MLADKPQSLQERRETTYGYVQGNVNLTCEAKAEPAAFFTWLKNGEKQHPSENVRIFNEPHKSVLQVIYEWVYYKFSDNI